MTPTYDVFAEDLELTNPDLSAVRAAFGWQPRHALELALGELVTAQRDQLTR